VEKRKNGERGGDTEARGKHLGPITGYVRIIIAPFTSVRICYFVKVAIFYR